MEIYICFCCGYPIFFRGRPPQIYHLGSGWPCWNLVQTGQCGSAPFVNLRIRSTTPKAKRRELLDEAKKLYEEYATTDDASAVLEFVESRLKAGESDCVRDLFEYLAELGEKRSHAMASKIVKSEAWQGHLCTLRIKWLHDQYVETGNTGPILRFIEGQLKAGHRECACRLIAYLRARVDEPSVRLLQAIAASEAGRGLM